jgi:antitoxin (DNA-binding transcriptional repressor) of toxin-antitoxin stability system
MRFKWSEVLTISDNIKDMNRLSVTEFKAQCLSLLGKLEPEGIVLTRHGKPIARVIPEPSDNTPLIGSMKGKIRVKGDIFSTGARWNAES